MRALWFTNCALPEASSGGNGHWMSELARALCSVPEVELGFVQYSSGQSVTRRESAWGPEWSVPVSRLDERHGALTESQVTSVAGVVDQFQPDVIHIHGTEQNFGRLSTSGQLDVPAVVSIQGLLSVYWRYDLGGLGEKEARRWVSLKDRLLREGLLQNQRRRRAASRSEVEILEGGRCFIGRTRWDRAHVLALNPAAQYFHCDEVMRAPFLAGGRDLRNVRPATVFTCVQPEPLKGLHILLRAMATVRREFPAAALRIAGRPWRRGWNARGFDNYLWGLLDELDLGGCVQCLGPLSGEALASELRTAAAAVVPSLVENGSNSLAEAMLVGVPSVASFAGGMGSTARDSETALLFPPGDAEYLAECLCEIFGEVERAEEMGQRARQVALARHDPARIAARTLEIYGQVISGW